jgi:hypothetical protein
MLLEGGAVTVRCDCCFRYRRDCTLITGELLCMDCMRAIADAIPEVDEP